MAPASIVALSNVAPDPADILLKTVEIRRDDSVLVIGPDTLGPLLAVMRQGCDTAMAIHLASPCRSLAPVDVLWVSGAAGLDADVVSTIARLSRPRMVILDVGGLDGAALAPMLKAKGLTDCRREMVDGHPVLIASRPPLDRKRL